MLVICQLIMECGHTFALTLSPWTQITGHQHQPIRSRDWGDLTNERPSPVTQRQTQSESVKQMVIHNPHNSDLRDIRVYTICFKLCGLVRGIIYTNSLPVCPKFCNTLLLLILTDGHSLIHSLIPHQDLLAQPLLLLPLPVTGRTDYTYTFVCSN